MVGLPDGKESWASFLRVQDREPRVSPDGELKYEVNSRECTESSGVADAKQVIQEI